MKPMHAWFLVAALAAAVPLRAAELAVLPADPFFAPYRALKADAPSRPVLRAGDRLAICGDSITEQKMYSRIMETYLTVCTPDLGVAVRQYGWSGERCDGFLRRMTNDVLRFKPTVATTCYGMNDHRYKPYEEAVGAEYRALQTAIVQSMKAHGVRIVTGSSGTVNKMPSWVKTATGTVQDLNLSLLQLRNLALEVARAERQPFADVYLPMLTAGFEAQGRFGPGFMIAGQDGVHPGWAGQLVMAWAFLRVLAPGGDLGTIAIDPASGTASATGGHRVVSAKRGEAVVESRRYPFCATGPLDQDSSLRAGMALVPFNEELNRLRLVVWTPPAPRCRVVWGGATNTYDAAALRAGVNLAADFAANPFSEAFKRVDDAVLAKQSFETEQIKKRFHGAEGKADMEGTAARTEAEREPLVKAIRAAFVPVTHTIRVEAAE